MSSKLVTIPKGVDDPYYRYKRHILTGFTYVHKNGGITTIGEKEVGVLCKELGRDIAWLITKLRKTLNCAILHSKGIVTIKKEVDYKIVDDAIEKIIIKYILCNNCESRNPETEEIDDLSRRCTACGGISYAK